MQVMNEARRQQWLRDNIVGRHEWPRAGKTHVGQSREVPDSIAFEFNKKVCELPPELMFMHEAVFASGEVVEDIPLEYKAPRMSDSFMEVDLEEAKYRSVRKCPDRVDDYINNSGGV